MIGNIHRLEEDQLIVDCMTIANSIRHPHSAYTLKGGLLFIQALSSSPSSSSSSTTKFLAERDEDYFFSGENGDDWFYFDDGTTSSFKRDCAAKKKDGRDFQRARLRISTEAGSGTTLIRFKYEGRPSHKVLHEGRCNFAGLKPAVAEGGEKWEGESEGLRGEEM
jgi:hypothetical protein